MEVLQPTPIDILTPHTSQDFERVATFVRLLCSFPGLNYPPHILYEGLRTSVGTFSLFFSAGIPIAWLAWDEYKNSVEIHAVIRPDLKLLFGRGVATRMRAQLVQLAFDEMLVVRDKHKLFFKVDARNRAVGIFAKHYGFDKLKNLDKGRAVYRLTQEEWLQRRVKEAKGREGDNAVSINQEL